MNAEVSDDGCWCRSELESRKIVAVAQAPGSVEPAGVVTPPLCVAPPQSVRPPSVGSLMPTDTLL